jgi:hypothetical protein
MRIIMQEGWNLISLPLQPPDPSPSAVLFPIDTKYNSVWAFDPDIGWTIYAPGMFGSLNEMTWDRGYWIKMNLPGELDIQGTEPGQTAIFLKGGRWNLVGYPSLQQKSVVECMSGVASNIDSVWEYNAQSKSWAVYIPGGSSDLQFMKPGCGYWIKANQGCWWDVNAVGP